jgi:hypothetical protein
MMGGWSLQNKMCIQNKLYSNLKQCESWWVDEAWKKKYLKQSVKSILGNVKWSEYGYGVIEAGFLGKEMQFLNDRMA